MKRSTVRSALVSGLVLAAAVGMAVSAGCQQTGTGRTYPATDVPRLVDLGTASCLVCVMMAPDLDAVKKEYAGRLQVETIDTWKTPDAKKQYSAPFCATQLFIDASGKERFRHVGYYSKNDIVAKWKELGIDLDAPAGRREAPKNAPQPKTGNG